VKQLLILRHADSSSNLRGLEDHERPLNERGIAAASHVGRLLLENDLLPERILCSDAVRASSTAELLRETSGYTGEVSFTPKLYLAEASVYLDLLAQLPDSYRRVMVIGHNPGLEQLQAMLTGERQSFFTASLAELRSPAECWADLTLSQSQLGNFWVQHPVG